MEQRDVGHVVGHQLDGVAKHRFAPRRIAGTGLAPGEAVDIDAHTVRGPAVVWRSAATFRADARGEVDLQRDAPVGGSYAGVSALGLIWSQAPETPGAPRDVFGAEPSAPLSTEIIVERQASPTLRGRLVQRLVGAGVTRRDAKQCSAMPSS